MKTQTLRYLSLFLFLLLLVLSVGLSLLAFYLITVSYENLIHKIVLIFQFPLSKTVDLKQEYLTIFRFQLIRYFVAISAVVGYLVSYFFWRKMDKVINCIEVIGGVIFEKCQQVIQFFINLNSTERTFISLTFLGVMLLHTWGVLHYPLMNDEVFSYLYLVDKGFLVTSTYYPGPNNHVFYLQCCTVIDFFSNDPVWIMRLPALIASSATVFCILIYLSKRLGILHAIFTCIVFTLSYNIFYYSIHGRGYVFMYFFFIVSMFSLLEYMKKQERFYLALFVFSNVLGMYSIPVFLYPFSALFIFYLATIVLQKKYDILPGFIYSNLCIAGFLIILYSPIFLVSGINSIVGNAWVKPVGFDVFWNGFGDYILEIANHLLGVSQLGWTIVLSVLGLGTFVLWHQEKRKWIGLFLLVLIAPFVILCVQKVFPYMRVWDYLFFIFAFLFSAVFMRFTSVINSKGLRFTFILLVTILMLYFGIGRISKNSKEDNQYYITLNQFMDKVFLYDIPKIYVTEDTYALFFELNAKLRHKEIKILDLSSEEEPDLIVIPSNSSISLIENGRYARMDSNAYIKSYKIIPN